MVSMKPSADLAQLAQRYWEFTCYEFPLTAISAGEKTVDAVVFREAPRDWDRKSVQAARMLADLRQINGPSLAPADRATFRLLERELDDLCVLHALGAHLRPSLLPVGPEFMTVYFANTTSLADLDSAERYGARLETIPTFLADIALCLKAGHASGFRYPRVVLERAIDNLMAAVPASPEESAWYAPFKRSPLTSDPQLTRIANKARETIVVGLIPALRALRTLLAGPLLTDARESVACTDDQQGVELYARLVQNFTTTNLSSDEVHVLGLQEVERIGHALAAVVAEAGFGGDLGAYRRHLMAAPEFLARSKEDLEDRMRVLAKRIDRLIPAFFGRLPRITYGVESIPESLSARMPPAYAQPSPADGSAPGLLWVSGIPSKCPLYMLVPLALHEGWPGHLMHIALMQEMTELPLFRRHNAVKYTACVEGWALYCEQLGIDMKLYESPHQHYGRLDMEMWRACRLVVDTGLHVKRWSRQQAIDYMVQHLSLTLDTITAEVDRYIALPGQALAYQIGNLKFRELRRRAEQRLGSRFSLRNFHDALMAAGPVTLPVLDDVINEWLSSAAA